MSKTLTLIGLTILASATLSTSAQAKPFQPVDEIFALQTVKPVELPKPKEPPKKAETPPQKVIEVSKPVVIIHKVQEGDNLSLIADQYETTWQRIYSKNASLANQDVLEVGQEIVIPNKEEALENRETISSTTQAPNVPYASSQSQTRRVSGEPNAYAVGWCTWWVKEKRPDIGGYWGNAGYNWISAAQASGFSTGSVARAGAIGVQDGHVVYVESVEGTTVNISEMGWNYSPGTLNYRSTSASAFSYIY